MPLVPPSAAPSRGGKPPATASAWRPDTPRPPRFSRGPSACTRLPRPLRQVHDLRDVLPLLTGDPALPGPEVRRAPGGTISPERHLPRHLRRLLLGLRDLHAGL